MFPILYSLIKPLACFKKWPFIGTNKRWVFDFWFLITIRKLSSIEPIIFIWSVLLMEAVYIIADYTK